MASHPLPTLFVSHGSPMVALEPGVYGDALARYGRELAARSPRGVVVLSAHWQAGGPVRVTSAEAPGVVHDFGGFPEALFQLDYAAPGAPGLAREVVEALGQAGVDAVADAQRKWDHGVWVPLRLLWPEARVPVVQVSLPRPASARDVLRLGEALRPLRERGVVLVGSGSLTHNLYVLDWQDRDAPAAAWARDFDTWVAERLAARDTEALLDWQARAPNARYAHPTPEHFLPFFFVLGAALPGDRALPVYEGFHHSTLSMRSVALHTPDGVRTPQHPE